MSRFPLPRRMGTWLAVAVLAAGSSASAEAPTRLRGSRIDALAKAELDCAQAPSVARAWNEQLLAAIRIDSPRPTVHARNLFHVSAAMYDAWAAFDASARPVISDESAAAATLDPTDSRERAISHAAYGVLRYRFAISLGAATTLPRIEACMRALGFDPGDATLVGDSAAAIGNRIAAAVIDHGEGDGSNELHSYVDPQPFFPTNSPMLVQLPGTGGLVDVNAWQPLIPPGAPGVQSFLTSQWRNVLPFALQRAAPDQAYADPGVPPRLGQAGDAQLRSDIVDLIRASSQLDPADPTTADISPAVRGNNPLGRNDGVGHALNPTTQAPYAANVVRRGDWTRAVSEFWADGPRSNTPPGHWNDIANTVSDHPGLLRRLGGTGTPVDRLEWDVKLYLALNGALHDAAIATWEVKRRYATARPITLVREMATLGQSSDPLQPHFHGNGLPLVPDLIELVTATSSAPGERHAHLAGHVGKIAIRAWLGHPADPATQTGGSGWILGERWIPYQQRSFVTPPFPGYTSGHSAFSRAAAEVLTAITGDAFFPGGLASGRIASDGSGFALGFEHGPSAPLELQWATYFDAADEAGISRIYGGIHPSFDDLPGRWIGHQAGIAAWERAQALFVSAPSVVPHHPVPGPAAWLWWLAGSLMVLMVRRRLGHASETTARA